MRAVWFIGKFELDLICTKYPNYSPKSRTPQQPQNVSGKRSGRHTGRIRKRIKNTFSRQ
jgi:hypothetical protein